MAETRRLDLVRLLTGTNLLLLVSNVVGGSFLFFTYAARPDGVQDAWRQWLGALWLLGPLYSAVSFVVAVASRKKSWETWANAAISVAYVLAWGLVLAM